MLKKTSNHHSLVLMSNAIRALTIDAIEKANSGHPGMPLGMADVATVLFSKFIKFDPSNPAWVDRDRFVLSAGHGSMLLYAISYLVGYKDCSLTQIKKFRQLGSKTAGHPEYGLLKSIETTTGPLGQGLANGVGMAIAEKTLNAKFGNIINHKTWVIVGDGCLMEGISQEAISLAGHLNLSKLIVLYDNNKISIDGPTSLTCSDNQKQRFEASNWNTLTVDGHDFNSIEKGISRSLKSNKPTLIICNTKIGFGSPNKSGKESSHGSPLGKTESILTKKELDWHHKDFFIPDKIKKKWRNLGDKGKKKRQNWVEKYAKTKIYKLLLREVSESKIHRNNLTTNFLENIVNQNIQEATRKSSQNVIEFLSENLVKNFIGGSADLTGSNLTKTKFSVAGKKKNNYIHYGVREHLMAGAMNGIAVHGGFIPYGGTFLVFSDYCKNAIRLSAMMKKRVIYILTHDSIGLGEDGPTHQPIEHLAGLRAIPNLLVLRPCDAIETYEAWEIAINSINAPSAIILSRQNLPLLRRKVKINLSSNGGYVLNSNKKASITFIATGSEVSIAKETQELLKKNNIYSNLVSMPSIEIFNNKNKKYVERVLGKQPRIVIEAGSSYSWHKFIREDDMAYTIDSFGESGKGAELFKYYGFNAQKIALQIKKKYFK